MALLTPMTLAEARAALDGHGLDVASVQALDAGSVNSNFAVRTASGQRLFVRVYEEQGFDGAAAELRVILELSRQGVPTPPPLARRDGGYVGEHRGKPLGVHAWVEGASVCFGRLTVAHAREVGRALARVHRSSAALSHIPAGRFGVAGLLERLERVDRCDPTYRADTARIRERLAHHGSRSPGGLPSGLIHGDLFRDNVLWRDSLPAGQGGGVGPGATGGGLAPGGAGGGVGPSASGGGVARGAAAAAPGGADAAAAPGDAAAGREPELVALLDFESASSGAFVYDLMVCVHAWCYGSRFEPALVRALLAGYTGERPLEPVEKAALVHQGALAALRFATTRLTDFSLRAPPGQAPGRDYRRFLARLDALEAGVLSDIMDRGST